MQHLRIYLLTLGAFIVGMAELVVVGTLHLIAEDLRISIGLAGQIVTAYSLAFAIGTPLVVSITSRMERKKLILSSLILFILSCLASFFGSNFTILMAARAILGVSAGVFTVVALSSVAKLVSPDKTGSAIGMIALGFGSAMALGVPIGIAVAEKWGWQTNFALLGAGALLVLLGLVRIFPRMEGDTPVSFTRQFLVLRNPVILSGFFIPFFLCASNSVMLTYLAPFLQNILHVNAAGTGAIIFILGILGAVGSRLGGFATDKWSSVRCIFLSLAVAACTLALLPLFTSFLDAEIVLLAVWICAIFMNAPAQQTYFIQHAKESSNLVLGLNMSVVHMGLAVGAATGGAVANSALTVFYHPWVAGCMAALGFGAAYVSIALSHKRLAKTAH